MVMIQYYTYIYKDPSKGMGPFYVGKGSGKRAYDHLKGNKYNPPLHYRIQKMLREGNTPEIEIINVTCENTAYRLEMFLIDQYGRKDLGRGTLLNMTNGGDNPPNQRGKKRPYKERSSRRGIKRPDVSKRMKENNPMTGKTGKNHPIFGMKRLDVSEHNKTNPPNLGRKQEIISCPHCGKSGGKNAMTRWHFANCKSK